MKDKKRPRTAPTVPGHKNLMINQKTIKNIPQIENSLIENFSFYSKNNKNIPQKLPDNIGQILTSRADSGVGSTTEVLDAVMVPLYQGNIKVAEIHNQGRVIGGYCYINHRQLSMDEANRLLRSGYAENLGLVEKAWELYKEAWELYEARKDYSED